MYSKDKNTKELTTSCYNTKILYAHTSIQTTKKQQNQ